MASTTGGAAVCGFMDEDDDLEAMADAMEQPLINEMKHETDNDSTADQPTNSVQDACAPSAVEQHGDNMAADIASSDADTDDEAWEREPDSDANTATATRIWSSQNASNATTKQVLGCYCRATPLNIPPRYTPPCLPIGAIIATREIQMIRGFRHNLLCTPGHHPKTQTMRVWSLARAEEHWASFMERRWIRVWEGRGHVTTLGWLLITHWDVVVVRDTTPLDCAREGRPDLTPRAFIDLYLSGLQATARIHRIQFIFRACLSVIA